MSRDDLEGGEEQTTPTERAAAEDFGARVDRLLIGEPLPPAMDSDERSLLEMATIIVASTGELPISPTRSKNIVEDALARSGAGSWGGRPMSVSDLPEGARTLSGVTQIQPQRKKRLANVVPWTAAALCAAAAIVLFVTRFDHPGAKTTKTVRVERQLPAEQRSRPGDALVGRIPRDRAANGSDRIRLLYADRLRGYRSLKQSRLGDTP